MRLRPDMYWLIGFRLLQGLGAGAIMPIASTIIGDIYSATERPKVMGYLSSVWGVSAIIGPLLGAFIVQHLPWALVFWVNLPIGLLAMFFLWRYLPAHQQLRRHALDLAGTAWLTLFVSALLLALLQMESLDGGWRRCSRWRRRRWRCLSAGAARGRTAVPAGAVAKPGDRRR